MKKNRAVLKAGLFIAAAGICATAHAQAPVTSPVGMINIPVRNLVVGMLVPVNGNCAQGTPQIYWNPPTLLRPAPQPPVTPNPSSIQQMIVASTPGSGTVGLRCNVTGGRVIEGPTIPIAVAAPPARTTGGTAPPTGSAPPTGAPVAAVQGVMDATKGNYDRVVALCRATPGCVPR